MISRKYVHIIQLLTAYLILLTAGILIIQNTSFSLGLQKYVSLLTVMTFITIGTYLLVSLGKRKGEKMMGMFLIAGIGGKFLSYLVMILVFWSIGKNLSKEFIIAFFVLYLMLTFFLIRILLKTLKTN